MSLSLWMGTAHAPKFPRLREEIRVDVAVVGGGIAGVTTAFLLKQAGLRVALLERNVIGGGETGHTTAHLTAVTDTPYWELKKTFGKKARLAWDSQMEAIDIIERTAAEQDIDCDFQRVSVFKYAPTSEYVAELDDERNALHKLGIAHTDATIALPHVSAIRLDNQGKFHPLKFVYALANKIQGDGSFVLEHSPVIDVGKGVVRTPDGGIVRAARFVFSTHTPVEEWVRVHTKISPYQTYAISFPYQGDLGPHLYYDNLDPYHFIRTHGDQLIVGGNDHPTGSKTDTDESFASLHQWIRSNIQTDFEPAYQWSGEIFEPQDGLPYIGERTTNHYFATGFSGTGMTFGVISAKIISDLITGQKSPYADLYDPGRLSGWKDFVRHNSKVAWHFGFDRTQTEEIEDVHDLGPGEGTVIRQDGKSIAVSRSDEGRLQAVSAVCTHAGCLVHWNRSEKSWDCPCHGSRFQADGSVRSGPAIDGLEQVDIEFPPRQPVEQPPQHPNP